jgi:murein DD-endopeptidase MepM/ murein hydrolase activator NlpD
LNMSIEKHISRLFEEIKSTKNSIKEVASNGNKSSVNEAAFISPVDNTSVNSPFGPRWGTLHTGVDLAANGANVKAPADGIVEFAAILDDDCGGTIKINHAGGFKTGYCHIKKINVSQGQQVRQGDVIGISGGGKDDIGRGRSDGPHLHFTLRKNGELVNPMDYLNKDGIDLTGPIPTSGSDYATVTNDIESTPKSTYARVAGSVKSVEGMNENIDGDIERIFELYELILNNSNLNEASSESDELFGGKNVKIPVDGAHAGQSGWASGNAWDVAGEIGTPVYAISSGQATTFTDYGSEVIARDGKKLFGQSFTVQSYDGLPDVYYTHLEGSPVTKGSEVKCGQFVGYIVDFPGSSYDHVHIGIESGNIRQFLNDDGSIKCAKGQELSGYELGSSPTSNNASEDAYNYATGKADIKSSPRPQYARIAGSVKSIEGINESRSLGKNSSNRYGRIILPKDDNPKIKSPISGKINNSKFFSGCVNQLTIENNDNGTTYLQYCGISSPSLSNGDRVSPGDLLGRTDTDVEVNMFDHTWSKIPITDTNLSSGKKETETDTEKKKKSSDPEYWDPFMAALIGAPLKIFQDKYDKAGNRTEKRYGGVADKKQVDPFVLNFLKDPFNRKKVNENIERIKKML